MTPFHTVRGLIPALRVHRWALPTVIVLGILSSLAEGLGIGLFAPLLDALLPGSEGETPSRFLAALSRPFEGLEPGRRIPAMATAIFVIILVRSGLAYLHSGLFSWLDADVGHHLRSGVFRRLLTMNISRLERDRAGHFLNVLASDTWRATEALKIVVYLVIAASTVVVYGTLLLLVSWRLTLVVLLATAAISFVMRGIARRTKRLGETFTRSNAELADRMTQGIDGMRVIRAFGQEVREQERFDAASSEVRGAIARSVLLEEAVAPTFEILAAALILIVLVMASGSATDVSLALVFLFVLYRLQPRLRDIDQARVRLATLEMSVTEVSDMLATPDPHAMGSMALPVSPLEQSIVFEAVSFRYPSSTEDALVDLSFEIPAGRTVAFAGPSGGGKSTIVNLLLRFHTPDRGRILVDGRSLQDLDIQAWRAGIALVSQDVHIFNASVAENIGYGLQGASIEQVRAAAVRAHADAFIRGLPNGYDTVLGHRGARLSGGQKQRISLARAMIRDPDVLILDEATSALDSISEQIVQEALAELRRDRTVIVIAHRLSTIERADRVIVVDRGRRREEGTVAELVSANGLLANMYRLQHLTPLPHPEAR